MSIFAQLFACTTESCNFIVVLLLSYHVSGCIACSFARMDSVPFAQFDELFQYRFERILSFVINHECSYLV